MHMTTTAVIYHSACGHTERAARAAFEGAAELGHAKLIAVETIERHWDVLDDADAMIFACPTYMGNVSAAFKTFMDATGGRWIEQRWRDKIGAGLTNSGAASGDKLQTLLALVVFAAQHGMVWVGSDTMHDRATGLNRAGSYVGVMTESSDAPVSVDNPPAEDLETARRLGRRVAAWAGRLRNADHDAA